MIDMMLYDTYTNTYTLRGNEYSAPERYIPTFRCIDGVYIESWIVNDNSNLCLGIAFNEEDYYDDARHNAIVKSMCERHNCTLTQLRSFAIPNHKFDEYVKRFIIGGCH